jgi:dTDP-4-amino-4,6-dideoxygalactose transaminase
MPDTSSLSQRVRHRIRPSTDPDRSADTSRSFRRLPPAITPVSTRDLAVGIADHRLGLGREAFRTEIGATLGASSTATYTSFRRALAACLHELAATTDEEQTDVLIPAFCSADYPDAIDGVGLRPRRYDIDPDSLSARLESLTGLPTDDALAVVVVNVLGYGSRMDEIEAYCRANDIYLIEALGYAYGATYDGDRLGTFGDCAVLNFQQGKPIPVGGGMVAARNQELEFGDEGRPAVEPNVATMAGYAALGQPRPYYGYSVATSLLDRLGVSPARPSTHPESKFDVAYEPPFATLSNFHGAVGRRVLENLDAHRRQRAATAGVYAEELADCPHIRHLTPVAGLENHQYVRYPLAVDDTELRAEISDALAAVGVETAALYDWPPLSADEFPGAAQLQDEIITLPTHPYVDAADRQLIVETVRDVATAAAD